MNQFRESTRHEFEELTASELMNREGVSKEIKDTLAGMFAWDSKSIKAPNGANNVKVRYTKRVTESVGIDS